MKPTRRRRVRRPNPDRTATMESILGYATHRLGGLASLVPRNRDEWLTMGLSLVKGEASHVFQYLATNKEQALQQMGGRIPLKDRIKLQQEIQYWRALSGLIDASNVVMPPDPPPYGEAEPMVDDDDEGEPIDG